MDKMAKRPSDAFSFGDKPCHHLDRSRKASTIPPRGSVASELGKSKPPTDCQVEVDFDSSNESRRDLRNVDKVLDLAEVKNRIREPVMKYGSIFAPPTSCCETCLPRMSRPGPYQ